MTESQSPPDVVAAALEIEARDVTFAYPGAAPTVHRYSRIVGAGMHLVVGPNGSGKSTLLKLFAGVFAPQEGTIVLGRHDLWSAEEAARRQLAYVPEHPDLPRTATILDNLRLVSKLHGRPASRLRETITHWELEGLERRMAHELSLGQRRRVHLAAAWLADPPLLILDEPLDALDRNHRARTLAWICDQIDRGRTLVVSTHEIEPFAALASTATTPRDEQWPLVRGGGSRGIDLEVVDALARGEDPS